MIPKSGSRFSEKIMLPVQSLHTLLIAAALVPGVFCV
jgi:hypothetical protein